MPTHQKNHPASTKTLLKFRIGRLHEKDGLEAIENAEKQLRIQLEEFLTAYLPKWRTWADEECLRRKTIALYGSFFSLKHQLEAEQTACAKPQELVWGVGIATWRIPSGSSTVTFEYPLLTQALEVSLDERTMALEVRPRSTDTRVEMDAFTACSVNAATEVEVAIKEQLRRNKERPVNPY